MKTWLKISIIILMLVILINIVSFYNSYFSATYGKVVDIDGKGIPGAKVSITYLCKNFIPIEMENYELSKRDMLTDSNGEFKFKSYLGTPNLRSCEKYIITFKSGYCKQADLCSNELFSLGYKDVPISEQEEYYYYNGSYYSPSYFQADIKIPSKEQNVQLSLSEL